MSEEFPQGTWASNRKPDKNGVPSGLDERGHRGHRQASSPCQGLACPPALRRRGGGGLKRLEPRAMTIDLQVRVHEEHFHTCRTCAQECSPHSCRLHFSGMAEERGASTLFSLVAPIGSHMSEEFPQGTWASNRKPDKNGVPSGLDERGHRGHRQASSPCQGLACPPAFPTPPTPGARRHRRASKTTCTISNGRAGRELPPC